MANAFPYLLIHRKLVAATQTPDKYAGDWKAIAEALPKLVRDDGFNDAQNSVPDQIRSKIAGAQSQAKAIRAGALAELSVTNPPNDDARKRALLLKTLSHLYYYENGGDRKMWIMSLPSAYIAHPIQYAKNSDAEVDQLLGETIEIFTDDQKRSIESAVSMALRWVERALIVVGDPTQPDHLKLLTRWFVPSTHPDAAAQAAAIAPTLRRGLIQIASGLKVGELIILDDPGQRGTGSKLEKSEAFTFPAGDLHAVWVEPGFWGGGNTLTGATNWARIIVHELTHNYCQTVDHGYSWQGLLPRESDVFRRVNNARVAAQPGFIAVRTLTMDQCLTNADTWAFFCADAAGALSDRDRVRALGSKLYEDTRWRPTQKVVKAVAQAR